MIIQRRGQGQRLESAIPPEMIQVDQSALPMERNNNVP
jgi:hypothetical protein